MRWALFFLAIALCLIFDQLKYNGHYRERSVQVSARAIAAINPFGS